VDNEKILEDFFRALRVAITNAFSYSKDHPYFIKSVENFKVKLEDTLAVLNPLKIGVTSSGIAVGSKILTQSGFYEELSRQLHQRKIKSVAIKSGATLQELIQFLTVISLPQKDIFKSGGINAILENNPLAHFTIAELDYSEFLHGQGQECNDIWGYMLKDAAHSKDASKLEVLADNFGPLMQRSSQKAILESEDVPSSIGEFLISLREKNKEKFDKCSKDVFLWLLHNKKSLKENELEKLKPVFKSLNQEDFSNFLWEGILQEDNFDALSLQLFSKISAQKDAHQIAENFLNRTNQQERLKSNPNAVKRVQDLLTGSADDKLSPVYRNILGSLMERVSSSGTLFFDQKALRQNFRYIVLNLFSIGEDQDNLKLAAEVLGQELPAIFEDNDTAFLKDLYNLLVKRKKEGIAAGIEFEKKLSVFIENIVLNQALPVEQEFLLDMVSISGREANYYLDKIFVSNNVSKQALSLFFRLFGQQMDAFYQRLEQKFADMDFLSGLINSLSQLEGGLVLSILEYIYSSANELIKIEALKAMSKLKRPDTGFLTRQLSTDSFQLRKGLLTVLMSDEQVIEAALDLLFKIPSPWGSKNKLLIENIQIAADLKITQAAGRIRDLAGKKFFWNRQLRYKAKQVLGAWNVL
jgi:hypothetical protein